MSESRFAALYRRYAPLIHARARRIVGDEAEDVVQEVFMRLVREAPDDHGISSWMYKTSTNICIDRVRYRRRRHQQWEHQVREMVQEKGQDVESLLADRQLCRNLMERADAKTQEVLVLVYFDQMTQQQAAEVLGINRKTVKERLSRFHDRARKQMARWLK